MAGCEVLVGACVDITHAKALEAELQRAQKLEALGLLAGGVAHDFNNILTVILGQTSLLELQPELGAAAQAAVAEITHAAEQAADLTRQLLAFGRRQVMQAQRLDLDQALVELHELVRRLVGHGIECVFESAGAPVFVDADRSMLTQVVLNLAVNARDAMPEGGRLSLSLRVGPLDGVALDGQASPDPGRAWALLEVRDTGGGIPAEVLPHIFEPFYTTKGVGQGTGLGLATVYGIVEQHRGVMQVESGSDRGTRFCVALPLAR